MPTHMQVRDHLISHCKRIEFNCPDCNERLNRENLLTHTYVSCLDVKNAMILKLKNELDAKSK